MSARRYLSAWALLIVGLGHVGCAVTEPEPRDVERVRAAVAEDPGVPIEQMSRELGISDVAVIAALPEGMRREWPADEAAVLLADMAGWGGVELNFEVIGHAMVYRGPMPSVTRETTRVIELAPEGGAGLSITLAKRDIASVWLLRYPGGEPASVWFCEELGEPWLIVRLPEKSPVFDRAWATLD